MPKKKEHDDFNHQNEEIDIGRRDEKTRLNITVNKDAVERAKAQGFNISAVIDGYLRALTVPEMQEIFESRADRINAFASFFDIVMPALEFLDIEIEIGEITDKDYSSKRKLKIDYYGSKILLDGKSLFFLKDNKRYVESPEFKIALPPSSIGIKLNKPIKPKEVYVMDYQDLKYVYRPEKILQNLLTAMLKTPKVNQKEAQKLKLASRFVKALFTENNDNSSEKGIEPPILRQVIASAGKTKSTEIPNPNRRSEVILV